MRAIALIPPIPKRRRIQFSLRTLLLIVTVFCVLAGWLGNQVRIVHERSALLHRILDKTQRWSLVIDYQIERPFGVKDDARISTGVVPPEVMASLSWPPSWKHPSLLRKWLGESDQGVIAICVPADADPADVASVLELFPEAAIIRTSDSTISSLLRGPDGPPADPGNLATLQADREHLARYYQPTATSRSTPSAREPPADK